MSKREHHIVNRPPQEDKDLLLAIGGMSVAFGRLEDMLKILQARVDKIDIDEFVLKCGQDKITAHKILKNLGQYYNSPIVDQVGSLFKIRNEFLHSTYTSDENGDYIRLREGEAKHDLQDDIKTLNDIAEQSHAVIPQLAALQPIKSKPLTNFSIRPANFEQDKKFISDLMRELQTHEKTVRPQRDSWDAIETNYLAHLQQSLSEKQGLCLLAFVEDQAIGMVCSWVEQPDEPAMDIDEPCYGYIAEGVVRAAWKRHGVYQILTDQMEAYFKRLSLTLSRACVLNGNEAITAFRLKNGYTPYYTCFEKRIA